jgi:hypothetical protein
VRNSAGSTERVAFHGKVIVPIGRAIYLPD